MRTHMLDTDTCIYLINRVSADLDRRVDSARAGLCISSIVFGELSFGLEKSRRKPENRMNLDLLLAAIEVVSFDVTAAGDYGLLRAELERKGTPAGGNDTLIGAHARSLGLTLVTNNRREFDRMPGLKVENWVA